MEGRPHVRLLPALYPSASSSWRAGEPEPPLHRCSNERGSLVVEMARQGWVETRPERRKQLPVGPAHSSSRKQTLLVGPERRGPLDRRGTRRWVVLRPSSPQPGFPPPAAHRSS